jgi:hypothetical protein
MIGNTSLTSSTRPDVTNRRCNRSAVLIAAAAVASMLLVALSSSAGAATPAVGLGTAAQYSVLAGTTVTNTGPSILNASLGVSPGSAAPGFPPGILLPPGVMHLADAPALQAKSDLTTAYNDAAGRPVTANLAANLVGLTLVPGVYRATTSLGLSGTVTLDGQGNQNSVFIFQIPSTLITSSASHVIVLNGAQACHVYWQVGSSATLGTASDFKGTVMALTSISVQTGATVQGRALARNGQVSLDNNVFSLPACTTTPAPAATSKSPTAKVTPPSNVGGGNTPTATGTAAGGAGNGAGLGAGGAGAPNGAGTGTRTGTGGGTGIGIGQSGSVGSPSLANTGVAPIGPLLGLGTLAMLAGVLLLAAGRVKRQIQNGRHAA